MSDSPTIRCTACRSAFTDEETAGVKACPKCGHPGVPMAIQDDMTVRINWHELRILTMWADNWAREKCEPSHQRALASIIRELDRQRPFGRAALTLGAEVRELQQTFPGATLVAGDGATLVKPKDEPS